jgi:hypothetical protein
MFGIGRTSTQTTLASVESLLSPPHSNRNSLISRLSLQQVCVAVPAEDVQASHLARPEHLAPPPTLSTIDEAHASAARSRSNSNTRAPNGASARPEETAARESVERERNRFGQQSLQPGPTELPRSSWGPRLPLSRLKDRFSRVIRGKSDGGGRLKEWELFGISISVSRVSAHQGKYGTEAPRSHPSHGVRVEPLQSTNAPSASRARELSHARPQDSTSVHQDASPDPAQDSVTRDMNHAPSRVDSAATDVQYTARARDLNSPVGESAADVDARQSQDDDLSRPSTDAGPLMTEVDVKRARILARRREKTLRSRAAARPVCQCHVGCHCHGLHQATESDVASESDGNVPSSVDVPDHPLGSALVRGPHGSDHPLQPRATAGELLAMGDQFSPNQRQAPAGPSTQAHRLSQATTVASNDSSISLTDGRHLGRPWSPPGWHRPWSGSPDAILPYEPLHGRSSVSLGGHGPRPEFTGYAIAESTTDFPPVPARLRFAPNILGVPERRAAVAEGRLAPLRVVTTTDVSRIHESSAPESEETTPRPRNDPDPMEGPLTPSSAGRR